MNSLRFMIRGSSSVAALFVGGVVVGAMNGSRVGVTFKLEPLSGGIKFVGEHVAGQIDGNACQH